MAIHKSNEDMKKDEVCWNIIREDKSTSNSIEKNEDLIINQLKPTALFIVAEVLSDMEEIKEGTIFDKSKSDYSACMEARNKMSELLIDIDTSKKLLSSSKTALKDYTWQTMSKVSKAGIEKAEKNRKQVEENIKKLEAQQKEAELSFAKSSEIYHQTKRQKIIVDKFWLKKNVVSFEEMKQLMLIDEGQNPNPFQAYSFDKAVLFAERLTKISGGSFHIPRYKELIRYASDDTMIVDRDTILDDYREIYLSANARRPKLSTIKSEWTDDGLIFTRTGTSLFVMNYTPLRELEEMGIQDDTLKEFYRNNKCFRISCSDITFNRIRKKTTAELQRIIDGYIQRQKNIEYKKLFFKKHIRIIEEPVVPQLFYAVMFCAALSFNEKTTFKTNLSLAEDTEFTDIEMNQFLSNLNRLYEKKYSFGFIGMTNAYSYLKENNLIGNGIYLYVKEN